MNKLWTGKTVRQELVSAAVAKGAVTEFTACECIEYVLDRGMRPSESGGQTIAQGMLAYWSAASGSAQAAIISEVRRKVKADDRIMGRNFKR